MSDTNVLDLIYILENLHTVWKYSGGFVILCHLR